MIYYKGLLQIKKFADTNISGILNAQTDIYQQYFFYQNQHIVTYFIVVELELVDIST